MNELKRRISEIMINDDDYINLIVKTFISKCSLTDFEILKDMEYDLNQKDNE